MPKSELKELNFYTLENFRKKLSIIISISWKLDNTPHFGYALRIGLPLLVIYSLVIWSLGIKDDDFLVFSSLVAALVFYIGVHFILKRLVAKIDIKYSDYIKKYRRKQYTKMIRRVCYLYFIIYYVLMAFTILIMITV
jgi:hypothetical protein